MRQTLSFAGVDLSTFGVYISGSGVFDAPERVYDPITIPGRNGALLGIENRLENIELTYPAFVYANFRKAISDLKSFLLSHPGYQEIADTYYPEEYRMGYYAGGLAPEMTQRLEAGNFDLTFNCKPQRYLKAGRTVTTMTATGTLFNPTDFPARPLLRVYGSGTITFGGVTITVTGVSPYIDIDCELMDAYYQSESRNDKISLSANDFPALIPGLNTVTLSGVTSVEITPRWWRV